MVIFPVKGDETCLYNTVAAFLYDNEFRTAHLRTIAHQYIIELEVLKVLGLVVTASMLLKLLK